MAHENKMLNAESIYTHDIVIEAYSTVPFHTVPTMKLFLFFD